MENLSLSQLVLKIQLANNAYAIGKPFLSDQEYDVLWKALYDIDPTHHLLYHTAQDNKLQKDHRPHKYQIFGTQKAFSMKDLLPFLQRFEKETLLLQPKYDGCAGVLYKQPNNQLALILEGDGLSGRDISSHLPHIFYDPTHLREVNSVEIVIPLSNWHPSYGKNPRAVAAGLVNSPKLPPKNLLELVSHNSGRLHVLYKYDGSLDNLNEVLLSLYHAWKQHYPLDGIMIKVADDNLRLQVAHNRQVYLWSIAWKPPIQTKETRVTAIEWNISRFGRCIPTIIYEPLELCGTTNSRATGHNAMWIKEQNLRVGSSLIIGKAGEIIPKILHVTTDINNHGASIPDICPSCANPLTWEDRHILCLEPHCPSRVINKMRFFCHYMGIHDFGPSIMEKLLSHEDILAVFSHKPWAILVPGQFFPIGLIIETLGEAYTNKYIQQIQNLQGKKNMLHFISSLSLHKLTYNMALKIYRQMKGWEKSSKLPDTALVSFVTGLGIWEEMKKDQLDFVWAEPPKNKPLYYSITGDLSVSRSEMTAYLAKYRWEYQREVTRGTSCLIVGKTSWKTKKLIAAEQLKTPMISENDLPDIIKQQKGNSHGG
jgi:NAD-dependent DNA ligase